MKKIMKSSIPRGFAVLVGWCVFVLVWFVHSVLCAKAQDSPLLIDDLSSIGQVVDKRTPITIGAPMSFEEMTGYYGGFSGFRGIGGVTGYSYPAYGSIQSAQQLPAYIQQELFEEYQGAGIFRPLVPGTGQMSGQLGVLRVEGGIGRDPVDPQTWATTRYVVVSSVGILEEETKEREIRPGDWTQIASRVAFDRFGDRWGIGGRVMDGVDQAANQSGRIDANRRIVGILYVAVVDIETRSVLKSSTGTAQISYKDLVATQLPGYGSSTVNYKGAAGFARQLVLAALYHPSDRNAIARKHQVGR